MILGALAVVAAVTWYPAADWTEKADPETSPYARRGGTIRMNGAQPQVETELRRHGNWWCQDLPQYRGTIMEAIWV